MYDKDQKSTVGIGRDAIPVKKRRCYCGHRDPCDPCRSAMTGTLNLSAEQGRRKTDWPQDGQGGHKIFQG